MEKKGDRIQPQIESLCGSQRILLVASASQAAKTHTLSPYQQQTGMDTSHLFTTNMKIAGDSWQPPKRPPSTQNQNHEDHTSALYSSDKRVVFPAPARSAATATVLRRHSLTPSTLSTSTTSSSSSMAAAAMSAAWKNSAINSTQEAHAAAPLSNIAQIRNHPHLPLVDDSSVSKTQSTSRHQQGHHDQPNLYHDSFSYPHPYPPRSDVVAAALTSAARIPEHPDASSSAKMKYILRQGQTQGRRNSGQSPQGILKMVSPPPRKPTPAYTTAISKSSPMVQLPEGTLHVWIYQARQLVFRRLFETMYERHGLRLRVYAGSKSTHDVGEIYETRRNYGGNMANPRWRRDQDDARDNTHGHFSIPLARPSLRSDTELIVEIVCGILVVAHTKISVPSLFLGSFVGTTMESLAMQNMQFRPHWFPLAGEDSGLVEMSLEFIPTRIVVDQLNQHPPAQNLPISHQPESEYDEYDDEYHDDEAPFHQQQQQNQQHHQYLRPTQPANNNNNNSNSPEKLREAELDRQRAREYEAMERHEQLRRQRFDLLEEQEQQQRARSQRSRTATTASSAKSSTSSSSARSTRFVLPRRSSLSDLEMLNLQQDQQQPYDEDNEDDLVIMDAYEASPPLSLSAFSGYEHHDDSRYNEQGQGYDNHDNNGGVQDGYEDSERQSSVYDELAESSASSSWALNDSTATQENLMNKQLWDLYRYGISDDSPEEINAYPAQAPGSPRSPCSSSSGSASPSSACSSSPRESNMSFVSDTSTNMSRKMSTMSQSSSYSVAFSDASEASMVSRQASTCASEILTYNDRIQRMEDAIRAAQDRRNATDEEKAKDAASVSIAAQAMAHAQAQAKAHAEAQAEAAEAKWRAAQLQIPAPIPTKPPPTLTPFGWERPRAPLVSPASSEPELLDSRKGVVLFDLDDIPVKGQAGQTDPALAAYRAKMLARRRSLPIHMLRGGAGGGMPSGPQAAGGGGFFPPQPLLSRDGNELNGQYGKLMRMSSHHSRPIIMHNGRMTPPPSAYEQDDGHAGKNNEAAFDNRRGSPKPAKPSRPMVVDSPTLARRANKNSTPEGGGRASDAARSEESTSACVVPGPPPLRRKRSSSLHSVSDFLGDQSFRIHDLATDGPLRGGGARPPATSIASTDMGSLVSDRRLSKASSHASSSDASSTGPQVVPTVTPSSAAPRVRRNSKGGGNVVQINGVALGIGKFINVGNVPGVIRYIGPTMFAPGQWIGIELVERKGKHNGTVQNVQYFECTPDHGIFIRAERLDISS